MNNFFEPPHSSTNSNNQYNYNEQVNLKIYRPDTNGNCIKANANFLKPFESSCINNDNEIISSTDSELLELCDTRETINYGSNNGNIAEITYIVKYKKESNSYKIDSILQNILRIYYNHSIVL